MSAKTRVLRRLVSKTGTKNERACGNELSKHASVLITGGVGEIYEADSEVVTTRGRCDLVIHAKEYLNSVESKRVVYVWELKAPQCTIFTADGNDRARPSDDLYSAENQLIHYVKSLRLNREWCLGHQISSERDVRIGGIIIGRQDDPDAKGAAARKIAMARRAREIREEFLYKNELRLLNWDQVIRLIDSLNVAGKKLSGDLRPASASGGIRTAAKGRKNKKPSSRRGKRKPKK
jgi:hypothetical protein